MLCCGSGCGSGAAWRQTKARINSVSGRRDHSADRDGVDEVLTAQRMLASGSVSKDPLMLHLLAAELGPGAHM